MNPPSPIILQGTAEWYAARLGKFTASNFAELMSRPSDKNSLWSKSAIKYIEELAQQLHLNRYTSRQCNDAMRWGMRHEPHALTEFGKRTGLIISEAGFTLHPLYPDAGATPDAIISGNGHDGSLIIAQVKCPFSQKVHLQYSRRITDTRSLKKCRAAYYWQIQGELWVTGADWSYFISYDPRLPGRQSLHYARIDRDKEAEDRFEEVIPKAVALRNHLLSEFRKASY